LQQLEVWESNPNISPSALAKMAPAPVRRWQFSQAIRQHRRWIWAAGALAVVSIVLAIPRTRSWIFPARTMVEAPSPGIPQLSKGKYVAILPFRVLGDEKSLRYVADGLEEALSAKLFQLQEVHVASSAAVEKAASADQPLAKIARSLGVNLILQGTIQGSADKMRITFDLEDVSTGKRLWDQEFSGVLQDLLTMEDQAYDRLVSALAVNPSNEELARVLTHPTENVAAYDLYLQGRDGLHGNQGVKEVQAAIRFFQDALQKDHNFALAYTGVADASLIMFKESKDSLWAQKALMAAQQAERLNPKLAEVHLSLGSAFSVTGKTEEAISELKRALAFAPNSDEANRRLGDAYKSIGRKPEANAAYQNAVDANPYYWYNHNTLGSAYFLFGDSEKALQEYLRVAELAPDNAIGYLNMGAVYFRQGKWAQSIPVFQRALALSPAADTYSNLGTAYFFLKHFDDAIQMFQKATELSPKDESVMGNLADAYRGAGKAEQANATYDRAIALCYRQLQVNPRSADTMADLARYYAKKGDAEHAQQYIHKARSIDRSDLQLIYWEAQVDALTNRPADALKILREAFQKGYSIEEALYDPDLGKLQGLPEFTQLVSEFKKKAN